jgi:hypothetical protein
MTDLEDRLRRDLKIIWGYAQQGPIRPLRVPPPRRRSRAVRWLAPVAAMAAVIGIIAGVSLAGRSAGSRPPSTALPAGTPKYYVTLRITVRVVHARAVPGSVTAIVRSSATGAALASVLIARARPAEPILRPWNAAIWITAAATDRVFAIADGPGVDILRLAPNGRIASLTHLPKKISSSQVDQLSPDGTELAVPILPSSIASCTKSSPCTSGLEVVSLATGATRTWLSRASVPLAGSVLSWPGSGHEVLVGYLGLGCAHEKFGCQYRLLNVAGSGGSLLANARRLAYPASNPGWGGIHLQYPLTPDGNAIITSTISQSYPYGKHGAAGHVAEFSATTGQLLRLLYTTHAAAPGTPDCIVDSLGPTGLHALIQCISFNHHGTVRGGFGRLDGNLFTALPGPSSPYEDLQAAW